MDEFLGTDWEREFERIGAIWRHDGNLLRPNALLTSGRISKQVFNGEIVQKHSRLFGEACASLAAIVRGSFLPRDDKRPHYCVGPAMGAIRLSGRLAEGLDCFAAYAEKSPDGSFVFRRTIPEPGTKRC
ncbi:MAG TPA: hypothetical protein VHC68_00650 [Candidatus Paceibacterota bacterium]|nr:hypothetical protein [Candidatus Paceibacterota bacterium]